MKNVAIVALGYLVLMFCFALFWFGLAKPSLDVPLLEKSEKIQCLSYAPFGKNESPFDFAKGFKISLSGVDKDLKILSKYTKCIRMYSSVGMEEVPSIARKYGLKMWIGAWVGADAKATQKEIDTAVKLVNENSDIVEVLVIGNEALLRQEVAPSQLETYLHQAKKRVDEKVVVTYADVWEFWNKHPEIASAVDRVTIHILPYWEDNPIGVDRALLHVRDIYDLMHKKITQKPIVIGETGWPSDGRARQDAVPSLENQAKFIRGFVKLANQEGWKYNIIEAFDQPWKRISEGAVGGYWGLLDADRNDKNILNGEVSNYPNALWLFVLTCSVSLLGLLLIWDKKIEQKRRFLPFFTLLFLSSTALVWQGNEYLMSARTYYDVLWDTVLMFCSFVLSAKALYYFVNQTSQIPSFSVQKGLFALYNQGSAQDRTKYDALHILTLGAFLSASLMMAFDGRYRNFDNGALGIIALIYLIFSIMNSKKQEATLLETGSSIMIAISALMVLRVEGIANHSAVLWVAIVLIFAFSLWQKKGLIFSFIPYIAFVLIFSVGFAFLRDEVLLSYDLVATCAKNPQTLLCSIRSMLGVVIYENIIGWVGFGLVLFSLWTQSLFVAFLATMAGIMASLLYNADLGVMVFVLAWFVIGYVIQNNQNIKN
ncbi:MAG: glycosyl hydrolase family 17 protein [Sulfurospirillaceae bacterium]|nr:glycosyl hydrolase family 17 protein [Sulfurospirillaceae bacterium]